MAYLVSSSAALALLTKVSEKHKSTSPSATPVKNRWKAISIEEKLDVISRLEKCDRIVDMWCNVRFAHNSLHTICVNADRIIEGAKLIPKFFVQQVYHSSIKMNHSKNCGCESLTFLLQ
jgi:hypothetical protein